MTEEVKKKIQEAAKKHATVPAFGTDTRHDEKMHLSFASGGLVGYSLASEEIERLKGLIQQLFNEKMKFYRTKNTEKEWSSFKQKHNL